MKFQSVLYDVYEINVKLFHSIGVEISRANTLVEFKYQIWKRLSSASPVLHHGICSPKGRKFSRRRSKCVKINIRRDA